MKEYQKGQVLIIVVLIMVSAITIGLSVATRTITNVRTSQEAENSEKAFSAAEAGIEQSLTSKSPASGTFSNNATYQTTVSTVAGVDFPLNNGEPVLKDDAADIWLSTYPNYTSPWTGTLTLYWGQSSDVCTNNEATNTMAALEIVVVRGTSAAPQVERYAVDSCSSRSLDNNFQFISPGGGIISGVTYRYRRTITVNSGLFIRIIPLYAPARIAVRGCDGANNNCSALPAQGTVIEAVGVADTSQRKLVTIQGYPKLPTDFFPYSFFLP